MSTAIRGVSVGLTVVRGTAVGRATCEVDGLCEFMAVDGSFSICSGVEATDAGIAVVTGGRLSEVYSANAERIVQILGRFRVIFCEYTLEFWLQDEMVIITIINRSKLPLIRLERMRATPTSVGQGLHSMMTTAKWGKIKTGSRGMHCLG